MALCVPVNLKRNWKTTGQSFSSYRFKLAGPQLPRKREEREREEREREREREKERKRERAVLEARAGL